MAERMIKSPTPGQGLVIKKLATQNHKNRTIESFMDAVGTFIIYDVEQDETLSVTITGPNGEPLLLMDHNNGTLSTQSSHGELTIKPVDNGDSTITCWYGYTRNPLLSSDAVTNHNSMTCYETLYQESYLIVIQDAYGASLSNKIAITIPNTLTNCEVIVSHVELSIHEKNEASIYKNKGFTGDVLIISSNTLAQDDSLAHTPNHKFTITTTVPSIHMAAGEYGKKVSLQGQYGTLTLYPDKTYEYALDYTLATNGGVFSTIDLNGKSSPVYKVDQLADGQADTELFIIQIIDSYGTRDTKTLHITLQGTDTIPVITVPNPRLSLKAARENLRHPLPSLETVPVAETDWNHFEHNIFASGSFTILDMALNDSHILEVFSHNKIIDGVVYHAEVSLWEGPLQYGHLFIMAHAKGIASTAYTYIYMLKDSTLQYLEPDMSLQDDFKILVSNNARATLQQNIGVTIIGTIDQPVLEIAPLSLKNKKLQHDNEYSFLEEGDQSQEISGWLSSNKEKKRNAYSYTAKLEPGATFTLSNGDGSINTKGVFTASMITVGSYTVVKDIPCIYGEPEDIIQVTEIPYGSLSLNSQTGQYWFKLMDDNVTLVENGEVLKFSFILLMKNKQSIIMSSHLNVVIMGTQDGPRLQLYESDNEDSLSPLTKTPFNIFMETSII